MMQAKDLFSDAGGKMLDIVKITLFRMLPRGAQINRVMAEINRGLLGPYGRMTRLEIDRENKAIRMELDLKGEKEGVRITISNYRLQQGEGPHPVFEPGSVEVSREWLDALLKTLVKKKVLPERLEVRDAFQSAIAKTLL